MNDKIKKEDKSIETTGVVYGNVGVGTTTYETNKFHGRQGHGFAAERAEHVRDLYHGEEVKILGDDNAKNGADRLVNGVEIQSKYCRMVRHVYRNVSKMDNIVIIQVMVSR